MRLSIRHDGEVRLTLPKWTPYSAGIVFIKNNESWISSHKLPAEPTFTNGMRVGKAHRLVILSDYNVKKISTRVTENEAKLLIPINTTDDNPLVQAAAKKVILRALKKEAERLLPRQVETLAQIHGYEYSGLSIKQLKSRWGSCNNLKQISLNLFLMQLPWNLIDYVIIHELVHTKVLAHGPKFWEEFSKSLPDAKSLRKQINNYRPTIDANL